PRLRDRNDPSADGFTKVFQHPAIVQALSQTPGHDVGLRGHIQERRLRSCMIVRASFVLKLSRSLEEYPKSVADGLERLRRLPRRQRSRSMATSHPCAEPPEPNPDTENAACLAPQNAICSVQSDPSPVNHHSWPFGPDNSAHTGSAGAYQGPTSGPSPIHL